MQNNMKKNTIMDLHTSVMTIARSILVADKMRTRVFKAHVAWLTVMGGISSKKLSCT